MSERSTRDIVVIGASLGGIQALSSLVAQLPKDLPAAVLVVQHSSPESPFVLPEILSRRGSLPAVRAEPGMALQRGRIVLAPPDRHLILTDDGVRVVFGAREHRSRPAIDPLFRTAAVHYRSRVTGVILTGLLGDGAAGLHAVACCGGVALVQAADDAAFPDMPRRALDSVPGARQVPLAELGSALARLTRESAPDPPPVPETLRLEVLLTERAMSDDDWSHVPGRSTDFTCPDCRGALRRTDGDGMHRYRCRVGHAFSGESLIAARDKNVEEALWLALQTLEERAQMLESMARENVERGWSRTGGTMEQRAVEAKESARRLREFVLKLGVSG